MRIHLYPAPAVLHSKHFSIDDDVAVIGSSNMDMRSFALNYEVSLMLPGADIVARFREVEDAYRALSRELTLEEWAAVAPARRTSTTPCGSPRRCSDPPQEVSSLTTARSSWSRALSTSLARRCQRRGDRGVGLVQVDHPRVDVRRPSHGWGVAEEPEASTIAARTSLARPVLVSGASRRKLTAPCTVACQVRKSFAVTSSPNSPRM